MSRRLALLASFAFILSPLAWGGATFVSAGNKGGPAALEALLASSALVGPDGAWKGGSDRLVLLGNYVPACPGGEAQASRMIGRLAALEREAAEAGGELVALLGSSELSCLLSGRALGEDDVHGDWLAERPLFVVRGENVFVHGGFSKEFVERGVGRSRAEARGQLRELVQVRRALRGAKGLSPNLQTVELVGELAQRLEAGGFDEETAGSALRFLELSASWVLTPSGPILCSGTGLGEAPAEVSIVDAALAELGAKRVVVSAARVAGGRIVERFGGRVIRVESTGSEQKIVLLELGGAGVRVHHLPEGRVEAPLVEGEGGRGLAAAYSAEEDAAIEAFLAEAEIVEIEEIGTGITKPERLTLRLGDAERRAAFKTIDQQIQKAVRVAGRGELSFSDRYVYEVAAFRLDRMLGLGATPVTIVREVEGRIGSVQLWVEDSLNELERREAGLGEGFERAIDRQKNLMHVFDILIFNTDRNQTNMLFTRDDWRLHLIDHSRAFRLDRGRPRPLEGRAIPLTRDIAERLEELTFESLEERLGELLSRAQIRSILKRRDALLEDWERARPKVGD